ASAARDCADVQSTLVWNGNDSQLQRNRLPPEHADQRQREGDAYQPRGVLQHLFLGLSHPMTDSDLARARECQAARFDGLGDGRSRSDGRAAPDDYRRDELASATDVGTRLDRCRDGFFAIVVARNHTRADRDVLTEIGIAEKRQMIDPPPAANLGRLQLDEVA